MSNADGYITPLEPQIAAKPPSESEAIVKLYVERNRFERRMNALAEMIPCECKACPDCEPCRRCQILSGEMDA
ncbi:MAG: hypothetical protein GY851_03485 [bacterium]|nr:hypothetical protein [bacterium]